MIDPETKALFAVNSEPIKWAESKPLTRESLRAMAKAHAEQEERDRHKPRVHYVSPAEFEEYVALGICDREGNFL